MTEFVLNDPLVWQAGHEYAMDAFAILNQRGLRFTAGFEDRGPLLESLAFLRHSYGLEELVRFQERPRRVGSRRIILAPRVQAMESAALQSAVASSVVITSDPGIEWSHPRLYTFARRNAQELADLLSRLC